MMETSDFECPTRDSRSPDREQRLDRLIERLPLGLPGKVRWLRRPSSRWLRIPAGVLLILGGFLSILPLFGIWMLPLGLVLLAEDAPPLQRLRDRLLDWVEQHRPHWFADGGAEDRKLPAGRTGGPRSVEER